MKTLSQKIALVEQKAQSFRSQEHLLSLISLSIIINNPAVQPCPQKCKANQHHSGPLPIPQQHPQLFPFHIFNFQRLPISHIPILEIVPFCPFPHWRSLSPVGRKMQEENKLAMLIVGGDGGESSGGGLAAVAVEELGQLKAEIVAPPMFDQLLAAHVACLRVATPIDQLPLIDDQLSESGRVLRSYESLHQESGHVLSDQKSQELDGFLTQYLLVLCSFKELLQNHVRVHAVEAVLACREIEHNLQNLTDVIALIVETREGVNDKVGEMEGKISNKRISTQSNED